jgi:LysM repeat protein
VDAGIILAMNGRKLYAVLLAGIWLVTAGCQAIVTKPSETIVPSRSGSFSVYQTVTPSLTVTPPHKITPHTPTLIPSATATPRTYTVKVGDDMSGIALRFRVLLADLKAANPEVNPRLMKIGTLLIIPGTAPVLTSQPVPTATAQPVTLQPAKCSFDQSGGAWCFVMVSQSSNAPIFNLTAVLRLVDETGKQIAQQTVSLGLDLLPVGATLPIAAYFSPPLQAKFQVGVQLVIVMPAQLAADRYPAVQVQGLKTELLAGDLAAEVSGVVALVDAKAKASQLHLLLVAFDGANQVAGVRRWDGVQLPAAGQPAQFSLRVYSLGAKLSRVEVYAEAVK